VEKEKEEYEFIMGTYVHVRAKNRCKFERVRHADN
jgi:hypothetical protein